MKHCNVCAEHFWTAPHRCKPVFHVWCPEHGESAEDARQLRAGDHGAAAEAWAERDDLDSAEYRIVGGLPLTLRVRKDGDAVVRTFRVCGESVPSYSADEICEPETWMPGTATGDRNG